MKLRGLRLLASFVPVIALLTSPTIAHADTAITLDCGDGSPITATVDADTLTKLEASIQSMADYPSGMTCSLQAGGLGSLLGGTSQQFVVGGGRFYRTLGGTASNACGINFSISAHLDSTGYHGTQTYTINNADGCSQYAGHIKADVTCMQIAQNKAEIRGDIKEATGFFSGIQDTFPVFLYDVTDNGRPGGGTPDMIFPSDDFPGTEMNCVPGEFSGFQGPVDNGNITVHGG